MALATSRTEYWKEYREKIIEQSRKLENPLNDKAIVKISKDIEKINPHILDDFNYQLKIPSVIKVEHQKQYYFDSIVFKLDNIEPATIKKIDAEMQLAETTIVNNDFKLDHQTGLVALNSIDKSDSLNVLDDIGEQLKKVSERIQHFPEDSKENLRKLNDIIDNKIKNHVFKPLTKVALPTVEEDTSNKNKIMYWSLLGVLGFFFALVITFVVLLMI